MAWFSKTMRTRQLCCEMTPFEASWSCWVLGAFGNQDLNSILNCSWLHSPDSENTDLCLLLSRAIRMVKVCLMERRDILSGDKGKNPGLFESIFSVNERHWDENESLFPVFCFFFHKDFCSCCVLCGLYLWPAVSILCPKIQYDLEESLISQSAVKIAEEKKKCQSFPNELLQVLPKVIKKSQ